MKKSCKICADKHCIHARSDKKTLCIIYKEPIKTDSEEKVDD